MELFVVTRVDVVFVCVKRADVSGVEPCFFVVVIAGCNSFDPACNVHESFALLVDVGSSEVELSARCLRRTARWNGVALALLE